MLEILIQIHFLVVLPSLSFPAGTWRLYSLTLTPMRLWCDVVSTFVSAGMKLTTLLTSKYIACLKILLSIGKWLYKFRRIVGSIDFRNNSKIMSIVRRRYPAGIHRWNNIDTALFQRQHCAPAITTWMLCGNPYAWLLTNLIIVDNCIFVLIARQLCSQTVVTQWG